MRGEKFKALLKALSDFIRYRASCSSSQNEEISIVMFNDKYRPLAHKENLRTFNLTINIEGGGTNFLPGMKNAIAALK
jgi:hypothetical protein